ncbi:MAG: hypothetical protein M1832_002907 [Thelocarpon impressellum]|nr:MAG: hypothetical protein M1832_002907 [Thelocarpon impressellum]
MVAERASASATPIPTTEGRTADADADPDVKVEDANATAGSTVSDDEWQAMKAVLDHVYDFRDDDGHDPSKVFHRKVNKRVLPDYYDVIKEPMALSTIKANIHSKTYSSFAKFTRDFALIPHNAQLYNRPEAGAYQDALVIRTVLQSKLKELVEEKAISATAAVLPDLGEIPPPSPRGEDEGEDDEEDDEDDDEDDADADDSDDDGRRRRKRRGPRSTAAITKRDGTAKDEDAKAVDAELRKKRGRPPRVDTPMEARIKAILKGLRKVRAPGGEMKISHFERLPDKGQMPEYFQEIKTPMAVDVLKRKVKRKKYTSVDHFMKDVEVMFENAKSYNQDESQIYKDAADLQREARLLAEQEKTKPDTEFVLEDGRLPLPNGILHNGELWKVGDWVHIQNPNDLTKPIVAQLYRTWQDGEGQKWVNACWYYRPEQTVHRYERHFFEHEVVKTGQYRDHHVDEIVDRCFVMFFTRFNKGRPRGFPPDKDVYVCESRYNEEKHKLNKIKTWASCLPDEVREKDYEMDLFEVPKKMKKVPSPIKHLLKSEAKETDEVPKPTWGVENAPPILGAVHKRPREANESPPPEPTPSPPPPPPRQPPRQTNTRHNSSYAADGDVIMGGTTPQRPVAAAPPTVPISHPPQQVPLQPHTPASYQQAYQSPAQPAYPPQAQNSHTSFAGPPPPLLPQYATPQPQTPAGFGYAPPRGSGNTYVPPKPVEVYHLSDAANASIPSDVRERFQRDEQGRVLFFTAPPLDNSKEASGLGHSVRYLAEKARRKDMIAAKRKAVQEARERDEETAKKARLDERKQVGLAAARLQLRALGILDAQLEAGTTEIWKGVYGEDMWQHGKDVQLAGLAEMQRDEARKQAEIREAERRRAGAKVVPLGTAGAVFLDDVDAGF